MRRAAKVDANHRDIVRALEACGCSVLELHRVGRGCPDLLVGFNGRERLIEVKAPGQSKRKGKTAEDQAAFREAWRGVPVAVVESPIGALYAMGIGVRP